MPSSSWSAERITALRQLWLEGRSAAEIAKTLGGVTRNAVIGKVHRLGLAQRMVPSAPRRPRRSAKPVGPPSPRSAPKPPPPPCSGAVARPRRPAVVNLDAIARVFDAADLGPRTCRWPLGDPSLPGFGYCGALAPGGGPYCLGHRQVAYRQRLQVRAARPNRRSAGAAANR